MEDGELDRRAVVGDLPEIWPGDGETATVLTRCSDHSLVVLIMSLLLHPTFHSGGSDHPTRLPPPSPVSELLCGDILCEVGVKLECEREPAGLLLACLVELGLEELEVVEAVGVLEEASVLRLAPVLEVVEVAARRGRGEGQLTVGMSVGGFLLTLGKRGL